MKHSTPAKDGLSFATAIIAQSVSYEYEWIEENYPEYQMIKQSLVCNESNYYDIITIITTKEETKKIYFDISSFYEDEGNDINM